MKAVYFKEGDFIIAPDKVAETFQQNDPTAAAVYDWESGRLIWRNSTDNN